MNARLKSSAIIALAASSLLAGANVALSQTVTVHVNIDSEAVNPDGSSWNAAFRFLQDGISHAGSLIDQELAEMVEIWVAQGTYRPDQSAANPAGTDDRELSFELLSNVRLYGGFAGHETSLGERNVVLNETILSGQIGDPATKDDNTFHVVRAFEVDNTAMLNGFTVRDGYAIGSVVGAGGAILVQNASPLFIRCHLLSNRAEHDGGTSCQISLSIDSATADEVVPIFLSCTMAGNNGVRGEAMPAISGAVVIEKSLISNTACRAGEEPLR